MTSAPENEFIPYSTQCIDSNDVDAVVRVLRDDFLTQGPKIDEFEDALKDYFKVKHCVVANSATSALHMSCVALGLGPGDLVLTSPNSFVSSATTSLFCGAEIDFVDICPQTLNMDMDRLEEKLSFLAKKGRLPDVVIPVHFGGLPCDMVKLSALRARYNFKIIEDASHAMGASGPGFFVGDTRFSDLTVFSFHPVKMITTGEGGAVTTNSDALAEKIKLLRSHGITRDPLAFINESPGQWYYEQKILGFNYRLTDIQAALGISQLGKINNFVSARNEIAERYKSAFKKLNLVVQNVPAGLKSSYHLFVIVLDASSENSRKSLFDHLKTERIGVNVHYIPIHTQPFFQSIGFSWGDFPVAEDIYQRCLSIPIFPHLNCKMQDRVIKSICNFFEV